MEDNRDSSDKQIHRRRSEMPKTADAIETLRGGETTTRHVPQEIVEQILVRLPVNSLLRFKCVAKSWLALISSPEFIKTQVTYSTILDPTLSNYRLVLSIWYEGRSRDNESSCLDSYVLRDFWTNRVGDADCPNNQTEQLFCINGSCNGLLCVSTVGNWSLKDVFLWNPCLRMSKKLPPPRAVAESNEIGAASSYDIFYDERNDDYKVVGFIAPVHDEHFLEPAVEIYSSKSDSWKRVDGFKGSPYSSVVCANGKVHFVGSCGNRGDLSIVSLDLENEVYGTVELLKGEQKRFFSLSIGVIKGCISALYCNKDYADVWILKEYGVKESWTRLVRIPCVDGPSQADNNAPRHLSFLWNGKYLLSCRSHLVVYDPEDGSSVYTSVSKGNLGSIASEGIYV